MRAFPTRSRQPRDRAAVGEGSKLMGLSVMEEPCMMDDTWGVLITASNGRFFASSFVKEQYLEKYGCDELVQTLKQSVIEKTEREDAL